MSAEPCGRDKCGCDGIHRGDLVRVDGLAHVAA